jgi:PAS domain S-box-containing protein
VAAIALLDPTSNDLVYRAAVGQNTEKLIGRRLQYGQGTVADVVRTGQGVVVNVPRQTAPFREGGEEIIVRAFAAAPVSASGQPLGVILGVNPAAKSFEPDVLTLLAGLGNLAGTALQNASLFEKLDVAQKRYRELFEDNIDPIVITGPAGRVVEINLRVIDLSGYTPDDLRGQSLEILIDIKPGLNLLSAASLLRTRTYESELRKQDGATLPVEVHVRKVIFDDTESLQWILRDITERKELDALRNDLTAMIYHDLRSPLANIVSALDVLEGMFTPEEVETNASLVGIARFNIDRIRRLIDSLLDINKLESGEAIANRAPFALNLLTDDLVKATQPRAEARHQTLTVSLASDLPLVSIDRDMIRRVLINLVENAIKYTPENGHIAVVAQVEDEFVRVWVQDNGPGIPATERERIFDKFARLKGHRTIQGLGIGLAFCRLAVNGHGGRIWVEPAPEQGSRFIFTLPISKE